MPFCPVGVRALDFLELHYEVDWPCNIVITEHSIDKCNTILHFLLQLKRTSWSLKEVFAYLKKCELLYGYSDIWSDSDSFVCLL